MNDYVADTHSLFWYLTNSRWLGAKASAAFDEADNGNAFIYVSAIVLAELFYINIKQGSPVNFSTEYQKLSRSGQFILAPFEPDNVLDFDKDSIIKEMHDRIIVGLARRLNAPLLKDQIIATSGLIKTIW